MREALKTGDMESFRTHGSELGRRDQEALTLAMRELSGQKEWKNMNNRELTEMNAFMASQGSNPILKNFSKINIGNAGNVRSLDACTEEIKGKIRESGADSLASADKDVIKAMGKNDSLATYADAWISSDVAKATSSDQMSSAAKAAWAQFAQQRRTNSKADAAAISNEQFADLNISQIAAAAGASSEQVQKIASGKLDPDNLSKLSDEDLYKTLMSMFGVGTKVANCIMLFAFARTGRFPVDVWIQRIEDKYYNGHFDCTPYPETAGIMQQFMFYYERRRPQE